MKASRAATLLTTALLVCACALVLAQPAGADRRATRSESRAMWRAVDAEGRCPHRRGRVSTVRTRRYRYGRVGVNDATCGTGEYVLRRRKGTRRWRKVGAGSDWGAQERCAQDLKRIPRAVLRDFFGPNVC